MDATIKLLEWGQADSTNFQIKCIRKENEELLVKNLQYRKIRILASGK